MNDAATKARKGRGASSNRNSRFDTYRREELETEVTSPHEAHGSPLVTSVVHTNARSIISHNQSPDIPFDQSINPYQGCEHGCIYCYARPTHAYLGLSPGLDFETKLFAKANAAAMLRETLCRRSHRPEPLALGANTDPYQPVERRLGITREILQVLLETRHPVIIVTKSALVERDLDLLKRLADYGLAHVYLSISTLDSELARLMEPRATAPIRRLKALAKLSAAGIPTGVLVAPIIPALTDADMEKILSAAGETGVTQAGYVLLRLPMEVADLFTEWLYSHYPDRAVHILSLLRQMRNGRMNDVRFGLRQRGEGPYADLIAQRFRLSCRRLRLNVEPPLLASHLFRPPGSMGAQLDLFKP